MRSIGRAGSLAVLRLPDVGDVQEGRALQADVDEGRLHAGQDAHDAARCRRCRPARGWRCARYAVPAHALVHDGDARFLRREVDQDIFWHGAQSVSGLNAVKMGRRILPGREASMPVSEPEFL
jgi:hypothetical protein